MKADGTGVTVGDSHYGQCDVADWVLFNSIDTLEEERAAAKKAAEERRKEIEARLAEIEAQLEKLN